MQSKRGRDTVAAGFMAISVVFFWKTISLLVTYSLTHESSSHILLIPIVSVCLLWVERRKVFAHPRFSLGPGLAIVGVGLGLYIFADRRWSSLIGNQFLSVATLALVLVWLGIFITSYGTGAARTATFSLLFLILMVPLPDFILATVIHALQQGSTEVAYLLFKICRVPVFREGFLLTVPTVTIEVATECSGIRSSVALLITCLLAAHLFLRRPFNMVILVLLAFPLAILKNGVRITTLTLLSIYVDPRFLTGSLHHDGGFVFFVLALAALAPVLLFMQRRERTPQYAVPKARIASGAA